MKIKIVYFTFLVPNKWLDIVLEQLNMLKSLDLYNIADIYMSVISLSNNELIVLKKLIHHNFNKIKLINIYYRNIYEYPGIKTVYELSENDDNTLILYFHSKGMISNQHVTRKTLFNHTIKNYNIYINEFINNPKLEVACMVPCLNGFAYYNFFWARSSYIYNYCSKPENTKEYMKNDRFTWEMWLGNHYCNKKEKIITYSPIIKYYGVYNEKDADYTLSKIKDYDYDNFDSKNILFDIIISKQNFETFDNTNNDSFYEFFKIILVILFIYFLIIKF